VCACICVLGWVLFSQGHTTDGWVRWRDGTSHWQSRLDALQIAGLCVGVPASWALLIGSLTIWSHIRYQRKQQLELEDIAERLLQLPAGTTQRILTWRLSGEQWARWFDMYHTPGRAQSALCCCFYNRCNMSARNKPNGAIIMLMRAGVVRPAASS